MKRHLDFLLPSLTDCLSRELGEVQSPKSSRRDRKRVESWGQDFERVESQDLYKPWQELETSLGLEHHATLGFVSVSGISAQFSRYVFHLSIEIISKETERINNQESRSQESTTPDVLTISRVNLTLHIDETWQQHIHRSFAAPAKFVRYP